MTQQAGAEHKPACVQSTDAQVQFMISGQCQVKKVSIAGVVLITEGYMFSGQPHAVGLTSHGPDTRGTTSSSRPLRSVPGCYCTQAKTCISMGLPALTVAVKCTTNAGQPIPASATGQVIDERSLDNSKPLT